MSQTEFEKFFDGLPSADVKIEDIKSPNATDPDQGKAPENLDNPSPSEPEVKKNRRHRRLEEQLERERQEKLEYKAKYEARIEALERANNASIDGNVDPRLLKAFGTSDEGKEVALLFSSLLDEKTKAAKEQALQEYEARQIEIANEEKKMEEFIETELESLEEEYGIDLTSNAPAAKKARRELLDIVEKLSPKDENGDPIAYADFDASFDIYQKSKAQPKENSRQKEIAARSMQQSSQGGSAPKAPTPGFRGWMRDFGIDGN